jgi:hypothetical protein
MAFIRRDMSLHHFHQLVPGFGLRRYFIVHVQILDGEVNAGGVRRRSFSGAQWPGMTTLGFIAFRLLRHALHLFRRARSLSAVQTWASL